MSKIKDISEFGELLKQVRDFIKDEAKGAKDYGDMAEVMASFASGSSGPTMREGSIANIFSQISREFYALSEDEVTHKENLQLMLRVLDHLPEY